MKLTYTDSVIKILKVEPGNGLNASTLLVKQVERNKIVKGKIKQKNFEWEELMSDEFNHIIFSLYYLFDDRTS